MAKYLVNVTEVYRIDTEEEAQEFINEAKKASEFELKKYVSEKRCLKQKGEIVDEWMRVTLSKAFNEEKEPYANVNINYEVY